MTESKLALIWVNAPHEVDGYFVEIIEHYGKRKLAVQTASAWFPTVRECEAWAHINGATKVEEKQ